MSQKGPTRRRVGHGQGKLSKQNILHQAVCVSLITITVGG